MDLTGFPITRSDALSRLAEFAPQAGPAYASRRNFVEAAGGHQAVSRLSAALRRRLVSEEEVVRAVLAHNPYPAAEKFISEIFWRTYWKGWLEQHRTLWPEILVETQGCRSAIVADPAMSALLEAAIHGRTGIDAFDHWAAELRDTGYLHNWARMQIASIWVFTLGLPWQLGAAWTFDLLIDADPASNTLSWRWVAGLQTAGKTYLASEDRIRQMTGGRLTAAGLASRGTVPAHDSVAKVSGLRQPTPPDPGLPTLLLLTADDLSLETDLILHDVRLIGIADGLSQTSADRLALADGALRAAEHWDARIVTGRTLASVADIALQQGCCQIVTAFAPVGPVGSALDAWRTDLGTRGLILAEHQRRWDSLAWPFCQKGFFQLKARIPDLLRDQGLL